MKKYQQYHSFVINAMLNVAMPMINNNNKKVRKVICNGNNKS